MTDRRSGYLVLYGSECHYAATAEEAASLIGAAGGHLVTVVRLDRVVTA